MPTFALPANYVCTKSMFSNAEKTGVVERIGGGTTVATPLSVHLVFSRTLSVPITKLERHGWLARSALDLLCEFSFFLCGSSPP